MDLLVVIQQTIENIDGTRLFAIYPCRHKWELGIYIL